MMILRLGWLRYRYMLRTTHYLLSQKESIATPYSRHLSQCRVVNQDWPGKVKSIDIILTVAGFELEPDGLPLLVDVVLRLEALVLAAAEQGLGGAFLEGRGRGGRRRGRRVRRRVGTAPRRLGAGTAVKIGSHRDYLLPTRRSFLQKGFIA